MPENQNTISKKLLAFDAIIAVAIVAMLFVISSSFHKKANVVIEEKPVEIHAFDKVLLTAKSAYVFDLAKNRVLYKKNELAQLPLASITKIMMAQVASELVPRDSKVTISKEFLREEGDTGLLANESWKLRDLLDFSLVVSSNDGARSIASVIGAFNLKIEDYDLGRKDFITKMNKKADALGLQQTYFVNESGLDIGSVSGGYGSAIDVATLIQYILKNNPDLLEATKYQNNEIDSDTKTHKAKNTNSGITRVPGLLASKTGYTELAGGNLVVAFDPSIGRPIIAVVLGSTERGRFTDMDQLVKASIDYIRE